MVSRLDSKGEFAPLQIFPLFPFKLNNRLKVSDFREQQDLQNLAKNLPMPADIFNFETDSEIMC